MFSFGSKKILGVDIGSSSIKVVEVKFQGGKPYLTNYAWMQLSGIKNVESTASLPDDFLSLCLARIIKEGNFSTKKANVSIPSSGGLITLIEFPETIKKDLDQAIRFEAHKYIPSALEDVVFSWDVVGRKGSSLISKIEDKKKENDDLSKNKLEVLLVAASKNRVEKYESIVRGAGLSLESIEIESFSLSRSLIGNDQRNFLIIDIGHRICNIILVEKGIIKMNHSIDVGGRDLTRIISRNMNLDNKRAEQVKMKTNFFQEKASIQFPPLEVITSEINRILDSYYGKNNRSRLDGLIISGGTASLKGIESYFSEVAQAKIYPANPFGRLLFSAQIKPLLLNVKPNFGVAVGLAIREDK